MSDTTDFISRLSRSANQIEQIGSDERKQFINRAIALVRHFRKQVIIQPRRTAPDALIDVMSIAASIDRRANGEVQAAFLDAADMIRTLKIVLDAEEKVLRSD